MAEKWIKKAIKNPGAFTAQAMRKGMTSREFAVEVLKKGSKSSERTKRRARLAQTLMSMKH